MRTSIPFLLSISICLTADASPSRVWWPAWTIHSSEELSEDGIEYSKNSYTPSFPLSYLFDNDAKTAWVYSAKSKQFQAPFKTRYGIKLTPKTPVVIDALRLMNGQNASRARFFANRRVVKIRVSMEVGKQKIVRTFSLSDAMGFHTLKLPRHKIKSLRLEFIGFKNGRGDNDLCLSELQLLNRGQIVDMKMPRAVMFYDGLEGDSGAMYLLRGSKMLDGIALDAGNADEWSENGRYVSGVAGARDRPDYLWIADAAKGEILQRFSDRRFHYYEFAPRWTKNDLQLTLQSDTIKIKKTFVAPLFK